MVRPAPETNSQSSEEWVDCCEASPTPANSQNGEEWVECCEGDLRMGLPIRYMAPGSHEWEPGVMGSAPKTPSRFPDALVCPPERGQGTLQVQLKHAGRWRSAYASA